MRFRLSTALAVGLLALTALLVYAQSLQSGFVLWDDDRLVTQSPLTQELSVRNVIRAFTSYDPELYVPLPIVSFQMEHALFGFRPFFFHLDNLLLHVLNAALVFLLLRRLGLTYVAALLCSLLFVVHPVNTEAVAWVSARKDLLSGTFILATMLSWLRYRERDERRYWYGSMLFLLLALLSKSVAIVTPAILFLMDSWRNRDKQSAVRSLLPHLLLSVIFFIIALYGKQENLAALTVLQTVLLAFKSTAFALGKLLLPASLSVTYLQSTPIVASSLEFLIPIITVMLLTALGAWSLRRTKLIAFALLFFALFLLPSFGNFAKAGSVYFFSDRYVYIAQIGLLILLGRGIGSLTAGRTPALKGSLLLLVFPLAWTAHARSLVWHDSETLYRDALRKDDRVAIMHFNLAVLLHKRGDPAGARAEYMRTLQLNPDDRGATLNLAILTKEEGDVDGALIALRSLLESDPSYAEAHNALGAILMDRGNLQEAETSFRKALSLDPTFTQARLNLGALLRRLGREEEAAEQYRRAVESDWRLRERLEVAD